MAISTLYAGSKNPLLFGSGSSEPLGSATVWPAVADWASLSAIASPRTRDRCPVDDLGFTPSNGVARWSGTQWELVEGYFATVSDMEAFPEPIRVGAVALVNTGAALNPNAVTYAYTGSWTRFVAGSDGYTWTLSSLRDFSGVGLRDGDYGVWMPAGSQPILLRYKAACTFAGGGTRPAWMTPIAYAGTPILQAWTDGTEDNTTLVAQGWTIVNDAGCSVTATGGFQRLTANGLSVGARLRAMVGTVAAATKVESIFETRADSIPTGAGVVWPVLLVDSVNLLAVGQIYGTSGGFGFNDGSALSGPVNTPLRNNTQLALPILSADPAVCIVRDEGRTVFASLQRDGLPAGDYRRNLQTNASNFIQVSCIRFSPSGTLNMDYRGQIITY